MCEKEYSHYEDGLTHDQLEEWERQIQKDILAQEYLLNRLKEILLHVNKLAIRIGAPFKPE